MCRLVAYLGPEIILDDVLVKPANSIISQSLNARESRYPTNGDGFGLGWYTPEISPHPALFKSISPAWNDQNLLHLTAKIKSPMFFAHVRAASAGGVTHYNCHPFIHKKWMLMHNGNVYDFMTLKRHIRHLLDDDIYHWVKGETDSELLFALFLQLAKGQSLSRINVVADILEEVFSIVCGLVKKYNKTGGTSRFNICLTDGQRLIATRYCTSARTKPESLHIAVGEKFISQDKFFHMQKANDIPKCIIIASEKLTNFDDEWESVPSNHIVMIDRDFSIRLRPLQI